MRCKGVQELYFPDAAPLRFFVRGRWARRVLTCYAPDYNVWFAGAVYTRPACVPDDSEHWRSFLSKFIKKSLASHAKVAERNAFVDPEFLKSYPALGEFLTLSVDDGKARETATLTVFFQDGAFKAFLNDRHSNAALCAISPTFDGLWVALEELITSDAPPWRYRQENGSMSRRKRP